MARQAARLSVIQILSGLLLVAGALPACRSGTPPPQAPATAPPGAAVTTLPEPRQAEPGEPSTLEPVSRLEPGTIVLDETYNVSPDDGAVEVSFESTAWQVIRIDIRAIGGTVRYRCGLVDPFGNTLAGFEASGDAPTETISELTLPYSGTYRLVLDPLEGTGTRQAVITALDAPSGGQTLDEAGQAAAASMAAERVYHTYVFPLVEGQVVTIAARAATSGQPDTRFDLYGPDGQLVAGVDDAVPGENPDAVLTGFVAPLTGSYVAVVANYQNTLGEYVFSVTADDVPPAAEGQPDLAYDRDYRAAFFEGSPLSLSFDGTVGDPLRVDVFDPEPALDVDIRLISPFGQVIAYALSRGPGQEERISEIQLPYSGRYRLELTPYGGGQASFRLTRLEPDDVTGGGVFGEEPSGTRSARIDAPGTFHVFQFNANTGDQLTLAARSQSRQGELDLGLALLGPDGRQVVFADDSEGDNLADPALTGYSLPQTGTYTIIVYAFNDALGTYDLQYQRQEP